MSISFPEDHSIRTALAGPALKPGVRATSRHDVYRRAVKRVIDVSVILAASVIVVPLVAALAGVVACSGGRPFYSQTRVGKDGRHFRMWKLRSMVPDADARMEAHLAANPEARAEWDSHQKLHDDPRITRFGHLLRCTSMDELPQLWNVLKGDMSLVGPRPMMTCQRDLYPGAGYYRLRPGITGYWQISGRNKTTFEARAAFDDAYEAEVSLMTDLRILGRTFGVVLRGTGC